MATATPGLSPFDVLMYSGSQSTQAISASTTKVGAVLHAHKTGNIRYIRFAVTANSGSPTVDARVEQLTSGLPNGTLWGTNTNANAAISSNGMKRIQLAADAAVTAGQDFAAVVGYVSGTSATIGWGITTPYRILKPYPTLMTAGSWSAQTLLWPCVTAEYDDGDVCRDTAPVNSITTSNLQSGTNPNERASVFVAPFTGTIYGVRFPTNLASTASYTASLYSGTSTTALATADSSTNFSSTSVGFASIRFASPVDVTAGTTYRLGIKATAAANVTVYRMLFESTTERDLVFGPIWSDTRNGSSWIGEVTTTSEMIFPMFNSVTLGGGLLKVGGMTGGFQRS